MIGSTLAAASSSYTVGRFHGARKMFDEIDDGPHLNYQGGYWGVPLYEGAKPAAVLWVESNVPVGVERHITCRKPGCGANWMRTTDQLLKIDTKGIAFADGGDYLEDLLDGR